MEPSPAITQTKVCILGAGPHGLAAAVYLRRADPSLQPVVVDPTGGWLTGWHQQFARAEIETLRSPIVHHPSPEPADLSRFMIAGDFDRSGLPFDPPTTVAFTAFCQELITATGLADPLAASAESVVCDPDGVRVETDRGSIEAEHLVVATNPHRRSIPDWVWPLLGRQPGLFVYGTDVDLRQMPDLTGERVLIIGGGLTAAHLALGATARGATVDLLTRRPLQTRNFDTEPGWLGPRHLRAFSQDTDPASRHETVIAARGGGSVPPWMRERLDACVEQGSVVLHEGSGVRAADVDQEGRCVLALDRHAGLTVDRVWLATGTVADIRALRCLGPLIDDVPALDGIPIVDDQLRLCSWPIHVMGRLAMLTLGPAAGNLWGAQRAAARIAEAITGRGLEETIVVPPPPAQASLRT
ncbi:MAG: FAD-dependent oxidoreductase [Actinomycetota bacterium]